MDLVQLMTRIERKFQPIQDIHGMYKTYLTDS
jgi:hypothetical protein